MRLHFILLHLDCLLCHSENNPGTDISSLGKFVFKQSRKDPNVLICENPKYIYIKVAVSRPEVRRKKKKKKKNRLQQQFLALNFMQTSAWNAHTRGNRSSLIFKKRRESSACPGVIKRTSRQSTGEMSSVVVFQKPVHFTTGCSWNNWWKRYFYPIGSWLLSPTKNVLCRAELTATPTTSILSVSHNQNTIMSLQGEFSNTRPFFNFPDTLTHLMHNCLHKLWERWLNEGCA